MYTCMHITEHAWRMLCPPRQAPKLLVLRADAPEGLIVAARAALDRLAQVLHPLTRLRDEPVHPLTRLSCVAARAARARLSRRSRRRPYAP